MSRSENRHRTELVGVRLLPAEREELEVRAEGRGMSLSEFIRTAIRNEIEASHV